MKKTTAISPTRQEDYSEWYQQVIKAADLAESSLVRGCMIIKPWGFGIWEKIKEILDRKIKEIGCENAYFPLFIPLSLIEKEAAHVEGFAKECAIVTHHRLESKENKLIPAAKLEEPLVVRPTSEAIIGISFSKWIQSHRDLPMRINQWANIVRWEMRTRLFLRTTEFLWQEGHTAHETEKEAKEEAQKALKLYKKFSEEILAIPVIPCKKTPKETFPGAEQTYSIEAMMQDKKALQAGTSHYLGQNFAKAFNITFSNIEGSLNHAYTTSWGVATRLIGGLIMTHSDDNGLRIPPKVAHKQIVIIPFITSAETANIVHEYSEKLAQKLQDTLYHGEKLSIIVDKRDLRGGEKSWQWVKKGIPIRIEVGMRDIKENKACIYRRDRAPKEKEIFNVDEVTGKITSILDEIQMQYLKEAKEYLKKYTYDNVKNYDELIALFTPKNKEKPEIHGGFVQGKWCGNDQCEEKVNELKITIRGAPILNQSNKQGKCTVCGNAAITDVIYAKAY